MPGMKSVSLAAVGAASLAAYQTAQAFVVAPPSSAPRGSTSALRGAGAQQAGADTSASHLGAGAAVGVSSIALIASRRGKRRTERQSRGGDSAPMTIAAPETMSDTMSYFDVASEAGVCEPMGKAGEYYWDPAGLSTNITRERFRWYRQAEIKHGRVGMMACLGLIVQHSTRFNFSYPYTDSEVNLQNYSIPSGVGALESAPASYLFGCLVLAAGIYELRVSDEGRAAGDFGDPLKLDGQYGEKAQWRNFELNHGRLAMLGAIGSILAEYATGLDAIDQWGAAGAAWKRTFALTEPSAAVGPLSSFFN